ncbi:MAG: hypothetical protein AB1656_21570 [Candidatus Omnitrophota bacterium]
MATRDGFAPPQGGWVYAWDGDVSTMSSISNNYFRVDVEAESFGFGYNNALCIDFICLKRGTFKPTTVFVDVNEWMMY